MWIVPLIAKDLPTNKALQTIIFCPDNTPLAFNVYMPKTMADLTRYHNVTLGVMTPPTLIKAINNGCVTIFPRLTSKAVRKYLPKLTQNYMLYIHKIRKNTRSYLYLGAFLNESSLALVTFLLKYLIL